MSAPGESPTTSAILAGSESIEEIKASIPAALRYVIAVHGIGDQFRNATIQTVVSAFGGFFDYPAGIPLGAFHKPPPKISTFAFRDPTTVGAMAVPAELRNTSFVEIYWADIPRQIQREGYTIEETKAWARTVVSRLRARYEGFTEDRSSAQWPERLPELKKDEYRAVADSLEQMIETFQVLGNLLWIAEKAGWLKFDLNQLLITYVGDVQIVADFEDFRLNILERFRKVLDAVGEKAQETDATPDIYIVAHSEGTVVAFMGLLEGMSRNSITEWYQYVRGFMTFGSPIDKHLVLWPDIWERVNHPRYDVKLHFEEKNSRPIWWKNYYDNGDPVGFALNTARDWMEKHGWRIAFRFKGEEDLQNTNNKAQLDDHGFSRYAMPGKAHNDYWNDAAVFGHFIENVIGLKKNEQNRYLDPPRTRPMSAFLAYVIPYAVIYLLCCLGSFLIYKATETYAQEILPFSRTVLDVCGIGALLTGTIGLSRILKLTRSVRWIVYAFLVFGAGSIPYLFLPSSFQERQAILPTGWIPLPHPAGVYVIGSALLTAAITGWLGRTDPRKWRQGIGASFRWLFTGTHPLVLAVVIQLAVMVAFRLIRAPIDPTKPHPAWPVVLAFGAFSYLWWLAVLLFDLVFVWHRYIRWAVAPQVLRAMRQARKRKEDERERQTAR